MWGLRVWAVWQPRAAAAQRLHRAQPPPFHQALGICSSSLAFAQSAQRASAAAPASAGTTGMALDATQGEEQDQQDAVQLVQEAAPGAAHTPREAHS